MAAGTLNRTHSPIPTQDPWRTSLRKALRTRTYGILSDEALVLRARAGDYTAFDVLVARYRDRLYTMALNYLREEKEAEDALSEAALSAARDIGTFDAKSATSTWLYMHGLRAVFKRMSAPLGRYTYENRPARDVKSRGYPFAD